MGVEDQMQGFVTDFDMSKDLDQLYEADALSGERSVGLKFLPLIQGQFTL